MTLSGPIAQRLEQAPHKRLAGGSNPSGSTIFSMKTLQFSLPLTALRAPAILKHPLPNI